MSNGRNIASGHLRAAVRSGMPACTPNSRAGYDAHVTTLRGSVGIAVAADDDRQAREFGVPAHFDRSLELVEVDVQVTASRALIGRHVPQSLRAKLSHLSPRVSSVSPRSVSW